MYNKSIIAAACGLLNVWEKPPLWGCSKPYPPVGKYDPCPCKSGKKHKWCHGAREAK